MKNEALRIFLAVTALILTAMLTNPMGAFSNEELNKKLVSDTVKQAEKETAKQERAMAAHKKPEPAVKMVHKSTRSFAFFFRR